MEENPKENVNHLKQELYKLYLDLKSYLISLNQNINNNTEIISSSDPFLITKTIQNYIEQIKNNNKLNIILQLENIILKLEKDLKYHIKKEFMLKIQKDSLDSKIMKFIEMEEEFQELKEKVRYEGGKFMDNDRKDNEIKILRRENSNIKREVKKMETKIKILEKKNEEDKEIINELNIKIFQKEQKIEELEKELETIKSKKNLDIDNYEPNNYYLKLPEKNSLSKIININSIANNKISIKSKRDLTNYKLPLNQINYESVKSNNNQRTMDNNTNKLIIHTLDKVNTRNNKNIIAPLRNLKLKDEFKYKNISISMRSDENKKFDLIGKNIPNINKYISNTKVRNFSKDNIKYGLHNLPSSNSNINIRHPKKEDKFFHEYSGLNKNV